jgi:hypothetical protein
MTRELDKIALRSATSYFLSFMLYSFENAK